MRALLPLADLVPALTVLRAEGYEVVSLSGGEPLLYPDLPALAAAARGLGFRVVAISNGFRVTPGHQRLVDALDAIAISFDGLREVHNRVRRNARAWDAAEAALRHLASQGKPAAAAYTVSRESLADVPAFAEFCAAIGIRAIQLRPLVMAGRAVTDYALPALTPDDLRRLWLMGGVLSLAYEGEMAVHTDLAPAAAIAADRSAWATALAGGTRLSDEVNPLVITADGRLRPYTHDFPAAHDLGAVADLAPRRIARLRDRLPPLRALLARTLDAAAASDADRMLDWFAFQRDVARDAISADRPGGDDAFPRTIMDPLRDRSHFRQ